MNQEQINQIVETIKTLNININDATTQKLAETVIPIVQMYIIRSYVEMFLSFISLIIGLIVIYKIIALVIKNKKNDDTSNY